MAESDSHNLTFKHGSHPKGTGKTSGFREFLDDPHRIGIEKSVGGGLTLAVHQQFTSNLAKL